MLRIRIRLKKSNLVKYHKKCNRQATYPKILHCVVTFKYKIPFSNHFDYRHIVDDHNGIRHMKPSLEQVWTTHRWPVRVFSFLLAVSEVNTYLAFKYFVWNSNEKMDFMTFRSKLAWSMINNMYLMDEESPDTRGRKKRHKKNTNGRLRHCMQFFFFGMESHLFSKIPATSM